jgi:hypothetical protein
MTITLELTPEEEGRLSDKAARLGLDVNAYLRLMVETEIKPPAAPARRTEGDRTRELLAQWREEDACMTPEQRAQAESEWQEIESDLQANRLNLPVPEL